jgi:hypothetical protein
MPRAKKKRAKVIPLVLRYERSPSSVREMASQIGSIPANQ